MTLCAGAIFHTLMFRSCYVTLHLFGLNLTLIMEFSLYNKGSPCCLTLLCHMTWL